MVFSASIHGMFPMRDDAKLPGQGLLGDDQPRTGSMAASQRLSRTPLPIRDDNGWLRETLRRHPGPNGPPVMEGA